MKDHHTTAKHFELFKKECWNCLSLFELNEWKTWFAHEERDALALCSWDMEGMSAGFILSKTWRDFKPDKPGIIQIARHEVTHLLLVKLEALAGSRFINETELGIEVEALVHKLEHIFYRLAGGKK